MRTSSLRIGILIPVCQPTSELVSFVDQLAADGFQPIVVVDDGSGAKYGELFQELEEKRSVKVLHHLIEMGKGSALRNGINHLGVEHPDCEGIVTVDIEGGYSHQDVRKVADTLVSHPYAVVLGVRRLPERLSIQERLCNSATNLVQRFMLRRKLADSQTGLHGISASLFPFLLTLSADSSDYEMDMLIELRQRGIPLTEVPLDSICRETPLRPRFQPILASLRAAFVFFRFIVASLATAAIDYLIFSVCYLSTRNILLSTILARLFAGTFNYIVCRNVVFLSRRSIWKSAVEYVLLVVVMGMMSYSVLTAGVIFLGANVFVMKALVEAALFLANFSIQQSLIFPRPERIQPVPRKTDWTRYYEQPSRIARLTRRITASRLLRFLSLADEGSSAPRIVEIGGGNSCFFPVIGSRISLSSYVVIDSNLTGLSKFRESFPEAVARGEVELLHRDVLELGRELNGTADICFSVGIVEHFSRDQMSRAVEAHFDLAREGGLVVISFPTPTWLYRLTRRMVERLGRWRFPDESPLKAEAVKQVMRERGVILSDEIIWPIFLTQCMVAARKSRKPSDVRPATMPTHPE